MPAFFYVRSMSRGGLPISTGMKAKITTASIVSEISSSMPMRAVPRMAGKRQAAERRPGGQRTEENGARRACGQWTEIAAPPIDHEIDIEGDADAEQQRQGDNVGKIKLQTEADADDDGAKSGESEAAA